MKIGKRTISFTGDMEIFDLKVAIRLAAQATNEALKYEAKNIGSLINEALAENDNNMEDAISSVFDHSCQSFRILTFAKELGLLEEKEMKSIIKNFSSIRKFCEKEMVKLGKQL
jgi:hypothetical protein